MYESNNPLAGARTTKFRRTADSVETVLLETFYLGYFLIDGVRGYVLWDATMENGVKIRN
jgi:hypothetical protein